MAATLRKILTAFFLATIAFASSSAQTVKIIVESGVRPLPADQQTSLQTILADLSAQVPGVLSRVVIENRPRGSWGTAGEETLYLERLAFDHDEGFWGSLTAHEFGHLAKPRLIPTQSPANKDWIDLFNRMFILEARKGSRILFWFTENNFSPARIAENMPYKSAPNDSELFAILFAIRYLWPEEFDALTSQGNDEERALVAEAISRCPVRPRTRVVAPPPTNEERTERLKKFQQSLLQEIRPP